MQIYTVGLAAGTARMNPWDSEAIVSPVNQLGAAIDTEVSSQENTHSHLPQFWFNDEASIGQDDTKSRSTS